MRKKQFSDFSFQSFFSDFEQDFFQILGEKSSKVVKTTFCVTRGTICGLKFFFKSFESFWNFCRNLWHGSQVSIYVSRVKFAEEKVFFSFFLSEFFRILSENFFRLLAEKRQEFVKTTFYASRGTICGLKYILKVLNRFGFSAEAFGMVLKFLYACPE